MRMKLIPKLLSAVLLAVPVFPGYAQVPAAATQSGIPLVVGGGFSDFAIDWGPGTRMEGISAWVDFYPGGLPSVLHGLGVEVEGRDINFGRPSAISKMRQDTVQSGPIYAWDHYSKFRPYVKYLMGVGSIDFPPVGTYSHDTFGVFSPGAGVEYHAWRHVWIRGDYQYQFWRQTFGPDDLNPNGFTIGASYDFRNFRMP
jgi:Outer membrane protein beta-barrel domain